MTDRPILFSGPMVRAILDGRKTQTRRLVKLDDDLADKTFTGALVNYYGDHRLGMAFEGTTRVQPVPYAIGDRLWIREAHALLPRTAYRMSIGTGTIDQREHPADGYTAAVFREGFDRSGPPPWRPSIFMPRWASRLTLTVTDVRVQRLQEISEADAMAEGIMQVSDGVFDYHEHAEIRFKTARAAFCDLWDSLNAARAPWASDPWIVAYSFTVEKRNIDQ